MSCAPARCGPPVSVNIPTQPTSLPRKPPAPVNNTSRMCALPMCHPKPVFKLWPPRRRFRQHLSVQGEGRASTTVKRLQCPPARGDPSHTPQRFFRVRHRWLPVGVDVACITPAPSEHLPAGVFLFSPIQYPLLTSSPPLRHHPPSSCRVSLSTLHPRCRPCADVLYRLRNKAPLRRNHH